MTIFKISLYNLDSVSQTQKRDYLMYLNNDKVLPSVQDLNFIHAMNPLHVGYVSSLFRPVLRLTSFPEQFELLFSR